MSGVLATKLVGIRLRTVVAATANVYDMLDNTTDEASFKARYVNVGTIHAYEITRENTLPVETESVQAIKRIENVVIYGYRSFQSGISEPLFQAEVDAICAAFDPPSVRHFDVELATLDLVPSPNLDWSSAPKVEGPRMGRLAAALVHYVRITVDVEFSPIF